MTDPAHSHTNGQLMAKGDAGVPAELRAAVVERLLRGTLRESVVCALARTPGTGELLVQAAHCVWDIENVWESFEAQAGKNGPKALRAPAEARELLAVITQGTEGLRGALQDQNLDKAVEDAAEIVVRFFPQRLPPKKFTPVTVTDALPNANCSTLCADLL